MPSRRTRHALLLLLLAIFCCLHAPTIHGLKVFVAGGTGRLGQRIARQLVAQKKHQVVVGAREESMAGAKELFSGSPVEIRQINLAKDASVDAAISGCDAVVCALGAAESEAWNAVNPYLVDGVYSKNLIRIAQLSQKCRHIVLVTSLGTGKFGWPAGILNLFWGVLLWKRQSERALENGTTPWTCIRPGGMENPTDSYEETHNSQLFPADTVFGGNISRLQVAKLVAACIDNPGLSTNKIFEITASEEAPRKEYSTLLKEFNSNSKKQ